MDHFYTMQEGTVKAKPQTRRLHQREGSEVSRRPQEAEKEMPRMTDSEIHESLSSEREISDSDSTIFQFSQLQTSYEFPLFFSQEEPLSCASQGRVISQSQNSNIFEIENIIDIMEDYDKDGKKRIYWWICWAPTEDDPAPANTWEPTSNLVNCKNAVAFFLSLLKLKGKSTRYPLGMKDAEKYGVLSEDELDQYIEANREFLHNKLSEYSGSTPVNQPPPKPRGKSFLPGFRGKRPRPSLPKRKRLGGKPNPDPAMEEELQKFAAMEGFLDDEEEEDRNDPDGNLKRIKVYEALLRQSLPSLESSQEPKKKEIPTPSFHLREEDDEYPEGAIPRIRKNKK